MKIIKENHPDNGGSGEYIQIVQSIYKAFLNYISWYIKKTGYKLPVFFLLNVVVFLLNDAMFAETNCLNRNYNSAVC